MDRIKPCVGKVAKLFMVPNMYFPENVKQNFLLTSFTENADWRRRDGVSQMQSGDHEEGRLWLAEVLGVQDGDLLGDQGTAMGPRGKSV